MPATTTSILSWGAVTISAAASAAYVNRRNSQDDILSSNQKDDNTSMTQVHPPPSAISLGRNPYQICSRNSDIQILTFVLGKD